MMAWWLVTLVRRNKQVKWESSPSLPIYIISCILGLLGLPVPSPLRIWRKRVSVEGWRIHGTRGLVWFQRYLVYLVRYRQGRQRRVSNCLLLLRVRFTERCTPHIGPCVYVPYVVRHAGGAARISSYIISHTLRQSRLNVVQNWHHTDR